MAILFGQRVIGVDIMFFVHYNIYRVHGNTPYAVVAEWQTR